MIFKILPMMLSNREERVPRRALGPFRTDAAVYATPPASGLRITWMGHSSLLVEMDGVRVLLDPVWDKRAAPGPVDGAEAVLCAAAAGAGGVAAAGRGAGVARPLRPPGQNNRAAAGGVATRGALGDLAGGGRDSARIRRAGERITELDWSEKVQVAGPAGAACEITSLPARHFSGRSAFNRFETLWASFVLRGSGAGGAGHTVYFGADSGWWEGFAEIGAAYGPFDLTLLEIGAYNQLWKGDPHGADGAAQAVPGHGRSGDADADPLGPVQPGAARVAMANGAAAAAGGGRRAESCGRRSPACRPKWCVGKNCGRTGGGAD